MNDILSETTMKALDALIPEVDATESYLSETEMSCGCTGDCGQSCAGGCLAGCEGDCGRSCSGAHS